MSKLSKSEAVELSGPITESEINESLLKLKNNKFLGIDGFPGQYYTTRNGRST